MRRCSTAAVTTRNCLTSPCTMAALPRSAHPPLQRHSNHRRRRSLPCTRLHRRAHPRRHQRDRNARDAAQDLAGRHHRHRRQLRHQCLARPAQGRSARSDEPAGKARILPLSGLHRTMSPHSMPRARPSTSPPSSAIPRCATTTWTASTARRPTRRFSQCAPNLPPPSRRRPRPEFRPGVLLGERRQHR